MRLIFVIIEFIRLEIFILFHQLGKKEPRVSCTSLIQLNDLTTEHLLLIIIVDFVVKNLLLK